MSPALVTLAALAFAALAALGLVTAVPVTAAAQPALVETAVVDDLANDGVADFWVVFDAKADLSGAYGIADWAARGEYVYDQLTATAEASQAKLEAELAASNVDHESFWIANTVLVRGGDQPTLDAVRTLSGVAEIRADQTYEIPDPVDGPATNAQIDTVEWGIANIRADQVWGEFGVRGEGIVVGSIDSGVLYTHDALVAQYRGNLGGGAFDHNYSWWDPSQVCGTPSLAPCDNNNHGTHTMGTMVGNDGGDNQIGVAPGAKWIAAKGCETNNCSEQALLSSAQFMLAPTDLAGNDPRPDLRPNVINNSWGENNGPEVSPFYRDIVTGWTAGAIFGVFSNGNAGPGCDTTESPADYVQSWGVGAFDVNNTIGSFSSRGPGENGAIRPNIAAPGVNVRSSVRTGGYDNASGTSMAAPHVSGAVALMMSAVPALVGDITGIRQILGGTAIDVDDTTCGGTADNNNVWGEGRLDAFAAVSASPRGPAGSLTGTVTDGVTGGAVTEATVSLEVGGLPRSTRTGADGTYTFPVLPAGIYDVAGSAFGYHASQAKPAEILEGEATTLDIALDPLPSHSVSGIVADERGVPPLAGGTVTIEGTPIPPSTIDSQGRFSFTGVPEGTYAMRVTSDSCFRQRMIELVVEGPETIDVRLDRRTDTHGHTCRLEAPDYIEATDPVVFPTGSEGVVLGVSVPATIQLPFPFPFYDAAHSTAHIGPNGYLSFAGEPGDLNLPAPLPRVSTPAPAIYPFHYRQVRLDLNTDAGEVLTTTLGEEGDRRFVIEWRNVQVGRPPSTPDARVDFEIVLHERGEIVFQYRNIDADDNEFARGLEATVGIERADPRGVERGDPGDVPPVHDALQYSYAEPVLSDDHAIRFAPPRSGLLSGVVSDANDRQARAQAKVTATDGALTRTVWANRDGVYAMLLPHGKFTVEFDFPRYLGETRRVVVNDGDAVTRDVALRTATVGSEPGRIDAVLAAGERRTFDVPLASRRSVALDWAAAERPGRGPAAPAPGDILASWPGEGGAWAYARGRLWLSSPQLVVSGRLNKEYTLEGTPTGREYHQPGDSSNRGLVFDTRRGWMCQSTGVDPASNPLGEPYGIACWDPDTGEIMDAMTGSPWNNPGNTAFALAYNPDDDIFYLQGNWVHALVIYQVAGFSHPTPGRVLWHCIGPDLSEIDPFSSGLAYNRATNTLWRTAWDESRLVQLDPDTCQTLETLQTLIPDRGRLQDPRVAAVTPDEQGNLWLSTLPFGQGPRVYLVESGVAELGDVPWLKVGPLARGRTTGRGQKRGQNPEITIDTKGLEPGVYTAEVVLVTNAGRDPRVTIPVRVEVIESPLLSLESAARIDGVEVGDEDIVALDPDGEASIYFDGSDVGLKKRRLDAFARLDDGSLALSFTESGSVPDISGVVDDSDLVRFVPSSLGEDTGGSFELWFDGSDVGLTADDEDIDAVDVLEDGRILLSTGDRLRVDGFDVRAEDVVAFAPSSLGSQTAGAFEIWFDGSDVGLTASSENIDAIDVTAGGTLGLSTTGHLKVPGLSAGEDDVVVFRSQTLGSATAGVFDPTPLVDGSAMRLRHNGITGVELSSSRSP